MLRTNISKYNFLRLLLHDLVIFPFFKFTKKKLKQKTINIETLKTSSLLFFILQNISIQLIW